MKASRKFLSLPVISLREGQHVGSVKHLVLDPAAKTVAALVIDPKGFFKDQKIIPYSKVVSIGDDALTIDKGNQVEKATNLPELLDLLKEKTEIIGTKIVTESGKTLGVADEYYIDAKSGKIASIEISGGKIEGLLNGKACLKAEQILTIGHDVIVVAKMSEESLIISDKGFSDSVRNLLHSTSKMAGDTSHILGGYFRKDSKKERSASDLPPDAEPVNAAAPPAPDPAERPSSSPDASFPEPPAAPSAKDV
ncbi:MAG: PRC-barrel domain-containing protein [Peptococcaceae bacterium]|nr:PRC-barrel domain-containing protein [Peptococcaceae bacterium]